jgi:hypothetical protein
MGIFDKLFGGNKEKESAAATATMEPPPTVTCLHTVLLPRWDAAEDIGKEDRATRLVCEACQQSFSPEEAQALRDSAAQRLLEITEPAPEPESKPE